ncbi:MAG TPA: HPF/RaiA family ribosome-associated protein [Burkholderiaceae bacterium]|nr:HPF/RaiA family ribosome-associated protein [Burkholderiaceae bacterium]
MEIQFNTDNHLAGSEALAARVETELRLKLDRFAGRVTRIEVHLSDVNSSKGGDNDKRCVMEARVAARQPISATARAPSVKLAIDGAVEKLSHALDALFGKLESARRGAVRSDGDEPQ